MGYRFNVEENDIIEFQTTLDAALQGSPKAKLSVALGYWDGVGVESDANEAIRWLLEAQKHKETENDASYYIGKAYLDGYGVEQNAQKALSYLTPLAYESDNVDAMYDLAQVYFFGDGVVAHYSKALELLLKAAEKDYWKAQLDLAERLEKGDCLKKNIAAALKWYKRLADNGEIFSSKGAYKVGEIYENYYGSLQQAIDWYLTTAKKHTDDCFDGYEAVVKIGIAYKYGTWFKKDLDKALYWLKIGAEGWSDDVNASFELADLFEVMGDYENAIRWYQEAGLMSNHGESYYRLGNFYFEGKYVEKNIDDAISCFEDAASRNHIASMYKLGEIYEFGMCGDVDKEEALNWYKKAADNFHAGAIEKVNALTGKSTPKTIGNTRITTRIRNRATRNVGQKRKIADELKKVITKNPNCPYCGVKLNYNLPGSVHLDHIYPVSKGGDSVESNLVYVCSECNIKKGDMTLRNFILSNNLNRNAIENRLEALGKDF